MKITWQKVPTAGGSRARAHVARRGTASPAGALYAANQSSVVLCSRNSPS